MAVVSGSLIRPVFETGGVGGAVHNSFPSSNRQGIKRASFGSSQGKLRKRPANPTSNLSNQVHTRHMEPTRPARIVWLLLAALMVAAWALIIWVATEVTSTALQTLQYIVDLAQMP